MIIKNQNFPVNECKLFKGIPEKNMKETFKKIHFQIREYEKDQYIVQRNDPCNDLTNVNRTDENAFTPLYGTNHKFNGWMDYFYVGNHTSNIGLQDINLKLLMNFDKFFIKLISHSFFPAGKAEYFNNNGDLIRISDLGTEIDFWAGYHIVPKIACIEFGYSHMFATKSMYGLKYGISPAISNTGMNNWVWIMLSIKPIWTFGK